jgi:predicted O-methyltransferase YrrM
MITDPHSYAEGFLAEDAIKLAARARGVEIGTIDITQGAGAYLAFLAQLLKAQSVVEVGTGSGVGSLWLLDGMLKSGTLTSIDDEMEHSSIAKMALADAEIAPSRFRLITNPVMDVMTKLTDRI